MSLLIGPDTKFIRMGSIFANRAGYYFYKDGKWPWEVSLEQDTRFIRNGSVPACCWKNKNDDPSSRARLS